MNNEGVGNNSPLSTDTLNLGMGTGVSEVVGVVGSTRRTSRVWRYFGMVDNCHYICRLCSFVGAYTNTTNMRKHIQHHHPERFQDILDHTRPTTRPFYTNTLTRMRPPQNFPVAAAQGHTYPLVYPQGLAPKRMILPKPTELNFVHAHGGGTDHTLTPTVPAQPPQVPSSQQVSLLQPPTQAPATSGLSYSSQAPSAAVATLSASPAHPNTVTACELSPEESKLVNQFFPPLGEATECSSDSDTTSRGLPGTEERGTGEFGQGGEDMPVSLSPEQFLSEASEREPTPAPPTPTPPKPVNFRLPESYQLRHNNHLTIVLEALARDEAFMDVTLTAQGRSLKAHKSVLSAVSPYFRGVLRDNPCQHPIIIMPRDVRFEELYSIVNYIYKGEMTVAAEDLTSLLKTAEILQVSGLAPSDSTATVNPSTESCATGNVRSSSASSSSSSSTHPPGARTVRPPKPTPQGVATPPARPKSRDCMINPTDFMDVDMTCVKEEVASGGEEEDESANNEVAIPPPANESGKQDEPQETRNSSPTIEQETSPTVPVSQNEPSATTATPTIKAEPGGSVDHPQANIVPEDPIPFMCPHCQEIHRSNEMIMSHLRLKHPSKPSFVCGCGRVFVRQLQHQAHTRVCSSSS
ncbi:protein bric-a-brac 2-like isoform X3 [Penaeus chinensis]|uniref:protein bric-a-brac 2-like isoform X3 n=1 Tax=Penaeus chinensis TaxID=139456 RepID=UPI001FB617D1|nr:protein bric-a-brac 2-like isoform X3 [Penaeus chinensis]XP_047502792.1 protein bric-a-brac 2-like isoform X3 [Penaeus chinensis]XP_047502793.1 protein bric-a-brac 2-like isoform X3 [Penaeus chinensis]XP_047502794.1 protein bric-a-brac 2-like isoform X3 [Penaeus chinensis]